MAENELAAGTPGATPEGAVADSGTPVASTDGSGAATVDADELQSLRNTREQFLREKENTERIRRENEELRREMERQRQGSGYPPPTAYDPAQNAAIEAAQAIQSLQDRDPEVARAILALGSITQAELQKRDADLRRMQEQARFNKELDAIPAERREEVRRRAEAERLWPSIVDDNVVRRQLERERAELAEAKRKVQEQEERLKRNVVRTDASPAPSSPPSSGEITAEEYDRLIASARKGNANDRKRLDDVERGTVRVRYG